MYLVRDLQRVNVLPKMFLESNQNKWRKFLENILIILTKSQELILQCCFLTVLKYFYTGEWGVGGFEFLIWNRIVTGQLSLNAFTYYFEIVLHITANFGHGVKMGPGPRDPVTWDPGPFSKFKSGTWGTP